ncbi:MAG: stage 0 sporulation family protein [Bacteroidota bacterium]|jgi:cell fate regulator YaaT (PSP1 superfamily)
MGCGSCGTGTDGKPGGCKSHGSCSTSGCNRMNAYNWLSALPLSDASKPYPILEVSFSNGSRKDFYKNNTYHIFEKDQWIVLEGTGGIDIGQVSLTGELVKLQLKKYRVQEDAVLKRVLRAATADDLELFHTQKEREKAILIRSRAIAKEFKLEMKVCEVELQADGKKATFFYTADSRVDFRELIKVYATDFKVKVEMRQIGARQESAKVGGIGSCGRELCCSTWLTDFKSVNTNTARYQNLSINQTKLSGQCGRLKCCLNYELDTYLDALSVFPDHAEQIETKQGRAFLQKKDIFKNLMWYSFASSNKQYPMTIERVKEIIALNKKGVFPDELQAIEIESASERKGIKSADMGFVNDVGQITLKALEKKNKNFKHKNNNQKAANNPGNKGPQPAAQRSNNGRGPAAPNQNPNQQKRGPQKPNPARQPQKPNKTANAAAPNVEKVSGIFSNES